MTKAPVQERISHIPLIASAAEYARIIEVTFFTPMGTEFSTIENTQQWGAPRSVVGPPGVGKTSIEKQFFRSLVQDGEEPVPLECFEPGAIGDAGVGVVPMPKVFEGEDVMVFPPHKLFVELGKGNRIGGVFVDEMSTAVGAVQTALLTLIQQGKIGTYYMPPRIRRNAAMNPEDIVTGDAITPAQANRFVWFQYNGPTMDERAEFRARMGAIALPKMDASKVEEEILKDYATHYAQASAEIMGWLRARPQFCNAQPSAGDPASSGPWPSDRSTEMAGRVLAAARYFKCDEPLQHKFVSGCIGMPAAADFRSWGEAEDIPNIEAFLDGKLEFEHNVARLDRTMAVVQGVRTALRNQPDVARKRQWAVRMAHFARDVQKTAIDPVVPLISDLVAIKKADNINLMTPEWGEILIKSGMIGRD